MYKRDYIMRMIEQLGVVYQAILGLKSKGDYDEAERAISRAGQQLLGFDMDLLRSLSDEAIISLLKRPDASDVGVYIVAAELLREQGEIDEFRRGVDAAYDCRHKSLALYLEACANAPEWCSEEVITKVRALAGTLAGYHLPPSVQRNLFYYYELIGDYAEAENVLFELAEGGAAGAPALGSGFYDRLRVKDDEELARGGLPRDEVEDGYEAFLELTQPG
jgi:hypothetical protein